MFNGGVDFKEVVTAEGIGQLNSVIGVVQFGFWDVFKAVIGGDIGERDIGIEALACAGEQFGINIAMPKGDELLRGIICPDFRSP